MGAWFGENQWGQAKKKLATVGECTEGHGKTEVEGAVGNQVSRQLHVKPRGMVSPEEMNVHRHSVGSSPPPEACIRHPH